MIFIKNHFALTLYPSTTSVRMDSSQRTAAATTDSELTTDTSALDLGNVLLTTDTYAHILEYVLDSLPAKILRETCTGVCSTWNLAVQKVRFRLQLNLN